MAKSQEQIEKLLDEIDFSSLTPEQITGKDGLLKQLTKRMLEKAMNAEMDIHLGYEKHQRTDASSNSRNGNSKKTVTTELGSIPIDIPRDRNSEFEPQIIPKHKKRFVGFDEKIISMYGLGMTTRDIQTHLLDIYGVEVSAELISNVTDAIMDDVREWRNRPLDDIYPIVYFDALVVKGRTEGRVANKSVYTAIGVSMEGTKEVLGLWIAETEGAKFWLSVITEIKNRGVNDILIACIDGLKGLPDAINSVYPKTRIQLCIVHMIRNSTKFVSYKERKELCRDLKGVYTALTEKEGLIALDEFAQKWNSKYPAIYNSWKNNWDNLNEFFNYPNDIRKAIYTTNAIESLNSSLRKVIKKRSAFPTDDAIYKVLYLALDKASKKWTMPIRNWGRALNQFAIHFSDRVQI
ncbi:MAG: IS256 family transposase [Spirochaetes bacterium]|nr:IS256 family transposase [Spirochaetota bacterium]